MPSSVRLRALAGCAGLLLAGMTGCRPETTNQPPVADAGVDQESYVHREIGTDGAPVDVFDPVTLDGSGSYDPDGDNLSRFFWAFDTVPVGSRLDYSALSPNHTNEPTTQFTPDVEGTYGFTLEVFDGQLVSTLDYVEVRVGRTNGAPVAKAGPDINGLVGEYATFDGSSSVDPDDDFLSYRWELVVVPPDSALTSASIVYPATPNPRIVPDVEGVYALALVVSDGIQDSAPDFVTLTVANGNRAPVVDAGESRTITPCYPNPVTLDGTGSYDPEGDPFSYAWSVLEVPYGSFVDGSSLTTPGAATTQVKLDRYGVYVFGLTLDDTLSTPSLGTVAIVYDDGSTQEAPVADAGGNRTARGQTSCTAEGCAPCQLSLPIDGTASFDPNDDPLSYAWAVIDGSATFSDPAAAVPTLTGPSLAPSGSGRTLSATVKIQLIVSDCAGSSAPSPATVTFTCEGL